MTRTSNVIAFAALSFATTTTEAFVVVAPAQRQTSMSMSAAQAPGFLHGQGSAFMPLEQLDQEYFAPRIVQVSYFDISYSSCGLCCILCCCHRAR
jgi:hypothetical protein